MDTKVNPTKKPIEGNNSKQQKRANEDQIPERDTRRKNDENTTSTAQTEPTELQDAATPIPTIRHSNVPMFKTLRKICNKLEQVNHYYDLLMEMQANHIAPKDFRNRINPSVPDPPLDLYTKRKEAYTSFTQTLTDILIEHC